LAAARRAGVFTAVRDSQWRQRRLLILGYHGVSLEDEHEWNPGLYMSPATFESRLAALERGRYTVLPLVEALAGLRESRLPPRSVVLTFDDGYYDFYARVFPALKARGLPATVYLTTYYCDHNRPVFGLICSYLLWKARNAGSLNIRPLTGEAQTFSLAREDTRRAAGRALVKAAERQQLSSAQKDQLAARLAELVGVDYTAIAAKRILHLMNMTEVSQLARQSVDFQLHTHRHRCPRDADSFSREILDNRLRIERYTGHPARHFCYPSGDYEGQFLPWLQRDAVASATTCNPGLATADCSPLLLPRFIDTQVVTTTLFEGWLSGVAAFLPGRRNFAAVR
jgi:peptidoglycan/xylan/chitin deacetylase (PgdA/CDA1 family)